MINPEQDPAALEAVKGYEAIEYLGIEHSEAGSQSRHRGISLKPLRRLLQRNWLLIGIPTLAAATITGVFVLMSPLTYSGGFQILVESASNDENIAQSVLSSNTSSQNEEVDYVTLVRVLTSPSVLSGIMQKLEAKYPKIKDHAVLMKYLSVERVEKNPAEKTKIIGVTYESSDTKEILDVLSALKTGYLKFGLEDRKRQIGGGVAFIEQQLPALKRRVETLEGQIQVLQQQYRISDLASEGTELTQQFRQVQTQQLEAQRDLAAQKGLYRNLQQQLGGMTPDEAVTASSLSENPRYQALLGQLKQLESQIALDNAQYQPDYPGLKTRQEQRNNLTQLLRQESQKLVGNAAAPQFQSSIQKNMSQQLVDTLNQVQVLEVRSQALGQATAAIEQQIKQFPEIKRRYNELQGQLEIAQNTLKQLQLKRESLRVEAAQKEIPWRLLSEPALLKDSQGNLVTSSRKGLQKLLLGGLGGFLLGIGAAILREKRQDVFLSLDDLREDMQWPILGVFPLAEKVSQQWPRDNQPEKYPPLDLAASHLKAADDLYTNLRFLPVEPGIRSLVTTSISPRDGKTLVATGLAKAAAGMGQRVLVVDANMAMPQVHSWLDVPNFEGLTEVLTNSLDPHQLIQRSPQQTNLFVLTSGQTSSASRKLMASPQMQHLMSQLHSMFDLVIYDTLSIQSSSDANFLARHSDGMLLVMSVGKTRRSLALQVLKKLQTIRLPLLGIVANQVKGADAKATTERNGLGEGMEDDFEIFRVSSSQQSDGAP